MFDFTTAMNSSTLGRVWRAGNHQNIETEEINLPTICTSLNQYFDNIECQPSKDPLGKLSVLINGAAKLYQVEANSLLRECFELDMEMAIRKTRKVKFNTASKESLDTSLVVSDLDDNAESSANKRICGSSSSKRKRQSTPNNFHNEKRSCLAIPVDPPEDMDESIGSSCHHQECSNGNNEIVTELNLPIGRNSQTHEKGVQANMSSGRNSLQRHNSNDESFIKDLPFGFVMIYDNYNDRLPSKIIYSSLNSDVQYL